MSETVEKRKEIKPGKIVRDLETDRVFMILEIFEDRGKARTNDLDHRVVPLKRLEPVQS
ncbi:MAG: hypothetical protein ACLFT7_08665 [Thermoplasmata archaeon]